MWLAYLFVAPALILLAVFIAYPIFRSFELSFYAWDGLTQPHYVGLRNYERVTSDAAMLTTLRNTIAFAVGVTVGTVTIGFLLAASITHRVRGWRYFKFIYFIPVMMSMTVTGVLWDQLLATGDGPVSQLLAAFGISAPVWLGDPTTALPTIIVVTIWQFSGFPMIVFLAAMENIPQEFEEAALLEGASLIDRLRFITLPLIKPVIAVIVLLQFVFSFKVFDIVWAMTRGGPGDSSLVLGVYLYRAGFVFERFGYASTIAVLMTLTIGALTLAYLTIVRPARYEY